MTQGSLLPLCDQSTALLVTRVIRSLHFGIWRRRTELAKELGVSIRAIRDAANHSQGQIISGNSGLKLTICADGQEMCEATGRFRSQIRAMTRRLQEMEEVWQEREGRSA